MIPTPTVGWGSAGPDGRFTLRVRKGAVRPEYLNADGRVNFVAIGWTPGAQGSWVFPAGIGASGAVTAAGSEQSQQVPAIAISASGRRTSARDLASTPGGLAPAFASHDASCGYVLQAGGDYYAMTRIGYTWPYGADQGWMSSSTTHSMTVGAAASAKGTYGSWSASGSSTTSSGVTKTWTKSINYRGYDVEMHYGRYRLICGGLPQNVYRSMVRYPSGGYDDVSTIWRSFSNCRVASAGPWQRDSSTGYHFAASAGVQSQPYLGISLSVDTNYGSTHTLYYYLATNGKVCGDNGDPSIASNVNTNR